MNTSEKSAPERIGLRVDSDGRSRAAQSPLDTKAIFRQMIEEEVRNGRLTPWRRRRIVRYAAQLRLSAVEAGKLIEECRREVQAERTQRPALTYVAEVDESGDPVSTSTVWKIWFIVVAAIVFDLLLLKWLS